jgi:PAS domain S-box-containing protein
MPECPKPVGTLEGCTCYLDAFFERSPAPLVLLDRDFNFIRVNEAYAKACQRKVEDFPGHNHFEFYPSDARVIFEEVIRAKEPVTVQARAFEFPDHPEWGVTFWDWSLTPLLDASGEVGAIVFSLQDVTDRMGPETGRRTWPVWLGDGLLHRRGALWVTLIAIVAEIALLWGVSRLESPSRYLGIPGAAAALIGVVAAVVAGPLAGAVVALISGVAFIAFVTDFGRTVLWPTIVLSILLWTSAAVIAGLAADYVRRRAAAREAVLSQSVKDRQSLFESLKISEEKYRALAAENQRLYQQQFDIAENLQGALLDIPAEIGAVRLGHLYRSASEAARVGGDFYDVFGVKDGNVGILVGDVSGHGIQAARTATLVKDVVHAFAHQSLEPDVVLLHTNQLLIQKGLAGFVTVFLGILECGTGRFRYASAGHPEAILRKASGKMEKLLSRSSPLGVFAEATWKTRELELVTNDRLLLYTDGVTEARRDGELFGEERLERLVETAQVPVEELPRLVLDEVLAFSGGALKDDVAVLALSVTESCVSDLGAWPTGDTAAAPASDTSVRPARVTVT